MVVILMATDGILFDATNWLLLFGIQMHYANI